MSKKNILELIREKRVYFDGAFGTVLQSKGLLAGEIPENWNINKPEIITEIHSDYLKAGSNVISTNTFGANSLKFENNEEIIEAALNCAKNAVKDYPEAYIAFDMGPTGKLIEPLGDLSFEKAVEVFGENARLAEKYGADLIIIETMNDAYETKAAVLGAKENSSLPVFALNVYDDKGKLMTGADAPAMVAMLEGLGTDVIGLNCSLGPDLMAPIVEEMREYSSLPILVNPNAGLPVVRDGKTVFDMGAEEFAEASARLAEKGASVLGGCCGTDPEYIKKVIERTKDIPLPVITEKKITMFSSYTHAVVVDKSPILIGERINPTGKPKFREALRNKDINYLMNEAIKQADAGVQALDVNVGLPEIDEVDMMENALKAIQSVTDLPLQIDTTDPVALERGMRIYNGKPLVNSVNGKKESMELVLPLVKKYGGAVIALTLDENGIPNTAEERLEIAEKIIAYGNKLGIKTCDIIVDPLALTVSSDSQSANVTINTIKMLTSKGIKTSLGVSNISFGLPQREIINSVFFANAMENGLSCAIMNPFSVGMMNAYYAFRALKGIDTACTDYISYASGVAQVVTTKQGDVNNSLHQCIVKGLKDEAVQKSIELIADTFPLEIINNHIVPALNEIGEAFEKGKAFLPQLLMSADAASAAFAKVKEKIPQAESDSSRAVILATVKGDIHDIGKNIVKVLMESYGFTVYDLGRDVPPEDVVEKARVTGCKLVGLSALMTTTVPAMESTVKLLHDYDSSIKTMVGGAVLNQEYADMISADFYGADAMESVRYAENYYK